MQFSLKNFLLFVVLVAGAIGAAQFYWIPGISNYQLMFGFYCMLLAAATAGAIRRSDHPTRGAWIGMAIFGWTYLALVLRGGFGIETLDAAFLFSKTTILGIALLPLSGLLTHLWLSLFNGGTSTPKPPTHS
jgi:hypothetical protein